MEVSSTAKTGCFKTKLGLLWMNLSSEPLIAIYSLIPIILRRELGASMFQIAFFSMLSPILSVLSFYWGSWLTVRKNRLLPNLIGAWILARIPFFFFPCISTFWGMFVCCGIYQLFSRATTPALMEILKRNIPTKTREHVFSLYYVLSVVEGIVIGLLLTQVLTICDNNWRLLFLICASISLTSVFIQLQIRISSIPKHIHNQMAKDPESAHDATLEKGGSIDRNTPSLLERSDPEVLMRSGDPILNVPGYMSKQNFDQVLPAQKLSPIGNRSKFWDKSLFQNRFFYRFRHTVVQPLKESFRLLVSRPDFATFQWGFMIGGFALMLIAPVRSIFIADILPVSLTDLTTARCVFVGLGMAGSSLIWRKALEIYGIHRLTAWILVGFGFYPLFLLLASIHLSWFYLAHLIYGIAQGGSHLVWHLSGIIFAGEENSTPFTTINVLMIGLRGIVGPLLGGILCYVAGPVVVLIIGTLIGLGGGWLMLNLNRNKMSHLSVK